MRIWVTSCAVSTSKRFPGRPRHPTPARSVDASVGRAGAQPPAAYRFRRQDPEQVEVGRFLVFEEVHIQPGVVGTAEHLEAAVSLDKAHGARYLLINHVRRVRDGGQAEEF